MIKRWWARWILWLANRCIAHGDIKWTADGCFTCEKIARNRRSAQKIANNRKHIARVNKAQKILGLKQCA